MTGCTRAGPEEVPLPPVESVTWVAEGDVTIHADWYPARESNAPAVALVHCDGPDQDRNKWPDSIVADLRAEGLAVPPLAHTVVAEPGPAG